MNVLNKYFILTLLIGACMVTLGNCCESPDCNRPDCGSCANACCLLEFFLRNYSSQSLNI